MGNNREVRKHTVLRTLTVLSLVVILTGCGLPRDTINVGRDAEWGCFRGVTVTVPDEMYGNEIANWTAYWYASTSPYTISWDFGGGAPNIPAGAGVSGTVVPVTMNHQTADATFTYTVTVTDGDDLSGTASGTYTVGATRNIPPVIEGMNVTGNMLTVYVSDADGDDVTVSVAGYSGITPDATSMVSVGGVATFNFSVDDMFVGANSTVEVTADYVNGGTATGTSAPLVIPPFAPAADTLYAIPLAGAAAVGDPVTILVYTGATANGFQFMLNVGLVVPDDAQYIRKSFNVGAVGGETDDADGVWAAITSDGGFILGPDALIHPGANPEGTLGANNRIDFNISPLGGTDQTSVEGALFNVQFTFGTAGTKTLTFQEFNGVDRTYYNDKASETVTYNWGSFVDGYVDVS